LSDKPVILDREGAIARIRFNRADVLNALNTESAEALLEACQRVEADPENWVVVISGVGRAFMAGGDVVEFGGELVERTSHIDGLISKLHQSIEILTKLRSPVVASVHGAVAGAGVSITLAADLAICADDTVFNLAYAKLGASPDGSSSCSLPRVVGVRKAIEIAMLSENIQADEALKLSMVNRVVPAGDLQKETDALVRRLASGPTFAYGKIKHLMRTSHERTLHDQLDEERRSFLGCNETIDFGSGVSAFLRKERASFRGS
jgi:2-(1,2-epoxy-1,2-dihydrophenyl)acetyl-CoA isomerase